ncbi:transposable element Tc1 transposase [Trichonephila clavipes]|nr:transposable element Tc1 transposase [Trichonephila clavipes]
MGKSGTAGHVGQSDVSISRCWQEWVDNSKFQRPDARLQWCFIRSARNHANWGCIVFSDECRFKLCPDSHRKRVWRHPGQRVVPAFPFARRIDPQLGITVWDAISFDTRTPLVVKRGNLQHSDNAKPHTARVAMNCLTARQTILRPDSLLYLSPIEHVWDMRGRRLHLLGNVDDPALQLENIWQYVLQETIRVLYYSMPRRVVACLRARGGSTPY